MAISKVERITLLNQIKIAKISMGFLPTLTLSTALLAIPLLTFFVSVVWSAHKIEKYQSQTQDFLKSDLHAKGGEFIDKIRGEGSNLRIFCTYSGGWSKTKDCHRSRSGHQNYLNCSKMVGSRKIDFRLDFADFTKLISAMRKEHKVVRNSTDVAQAVPVPHLVVEKIENGTSTTGTGTGAGNGAAAVTKNVMYTTTSSAPSASSSISSSTSTAQVASPETIPKPTMETLVNRGINNKSYSTRKPAENTTRKLKITGTRPSFPQDFDFLFRAMAAIQRKPGTNKHIISHFTATTTPHPHQPLRHRRRHSKRLRFGK